METFAICSNSNCTYSTPFNPVPFAVNENTILESESDFNLPINRFCELCGATLLFYCPHCKKGLFTNPKAKHCRYCGINFKPRVWETPG
jgi:hypothetical protein